MNTIHLEIMDHILQPEHIGLDMRQLFAKCDCIATSTTADTILIRSHIAYWLSAAVAEKAIISPSRGHSYRVSFWPHRKENDKIVRIGDPYDHRDGVTGIR